MTDAEEGGYPPPFPRRWKWLGFLVELSKIPVGVTYGLLAIADSVHSAVGEIHSDLVAHYNYLRSQDAFRESVSRDLEMLRER